MVYRANVLSVMIASPSDVFEQRNDARAVISDWNYAHSFSRRLILMSVGWETHSAPDLSGRPQAIINERLLKDCDLLIGIFWTRLGTPTGAFESGTAEEIMHHIEDGRPAMIYFSDAPVAPQSLDSAEFERVRSFRERLYKLGLVEVFTSPDEFRTKFRQHLAIQLNEHPYLKSVLASFAEDNNEAYSPDLTMEARQLLLAAGEDDSGHIMAFSTLGGRFIQTNGQTFGDAASARSSALWEAALNELKARAYITPRGNRGEVFQLSNAGYVKIDQLRSVDYG